MQGEEVKIVQPTVSVIIPVYNGEKYIKQCLDSLSMQTLPAEQYETIIVDNGSSDTSVQIAESYDVKLLKESKRGSYAARNKGIKNSLGDIIAFTDVDCIAAKDWLEQAVKYYDDNNDVEIIAGRVEFFSDQMLSVWGSFDKNTFLNQEYAIKTGSAKTANMFVKKMLFNKVGLFDDSLFSGGDVHWTAKAFINSANIHYHPESIVYHPIRNNYKEVGSKCYRVGYGKGQVLKQGKGAWTDTNLNTNHLRHPLSLISGLPLHNEKGNKVFFLARMMGAIFILSVLFVSGMIKGYFRLWL